MRNQSLLLIALVLAIDLCVAGPQAPTLAQDPGPVLSSIAQDSAPLAAVVVYSQPPRPSGGLVLSSLRDPDGSATDQWAWDNFRFVWAQAITEIHWRGGYDPTRLGSGGPVFDFIVDIYPSTPSNIEPAVAFPPLVHYHVGGNAGEVASDILGGVQTYDYQFVLPVPFQAIAGTKYWVQIEALQSGAPDWGLSVSASGDGYHFRYAASEYVYRLVPGDTAFTLLAASLSGYRIYLPFVSRN